MPKKSLPPLSEARKRLDDNVKSPTVRALGSFRVSWSDGAVLRDALIAGDTLARDVTRLTSQLDASINGHGSYE
jgi:hypothetical protein